LAGIWDTEDIPAEGAPGERSWARRRAARAAALVLFPFVLALATVTGGLLQFMPHAEREIAAVARSFPNACGSADVKSVDETVERLQAEAYGAPGAARRPSEKDLERYGVLIRTVAHRCRAQQCGDDRSAVQCDPSLLGARRAMQKAALGDMVGKCFILFAFAALFVGAFFSAARTVAAATGKVKTGFASFSEAVLYRRSRRLLIEQSRAYFWRRFAFAFGLSVGGQYVFAPWGWQTTHVGQFVTYFSLPGHVAHPFILEHFADAPPVIMGFVGFALYAWVTCFRRFVLGSLNHHLLVGMVNRMVVVLILGLVLSSVVGENAESRAFAFVVGLVPQTGLDAIGKLARTSVDRLMLDYSTGFQGLPEFDIAKQSALQELGIESLHDLARMDAAEVMISAGVAPTVLLEAIDRAILLDTFGPEGVKKLETVPLYTATELVIYVTTGKGAFAGRLPRTPMRIADAPPLEQAEKERRCALVQGALGVTDLSLQLAQLADDKNVQYLFDQKLMYGHH
jgi:hypothetical protein